MHTPRNLPGAPVLALLGVLLALGAVGCDGLGVSGDHEHRVDDRTKAAKSFDPGEIPPATFKDNKGTNWTISGDQNVLISGTTHTYSYTVSVDATPSTSAFIALETPACAGTWVSADPVPGVNSNANGAIEWKASDLTWGADNKATVSYSFDYEGTDPLPLGLVRVSFKSSGTGSDVETGAVLGPCSGVQTLSGRVVQFEKPFENRPGTTTGLAGVQLEIWDDSDGDGIYMPDFNIETKADGTFSVDVWAPSVHSGKYRVILASDYFYTSTFLKPVDALAKLPLPDGRYYLDASVAESDAAVSFRFFVDASEVINLFNLNQAFSDMREREYWRVQVTGKGSPKYQPEMDRVVVCGFLKDFITQFPDAADLFVDWSAIVCGTPSGSSVDGVLTSDGISALSYAGDILKNDNKSNLYSALHTKLLVMGLNYSDGRGLCFEDPSGDRCAAVDDDGTRMIIEKVITVLRDDDHPSNAYYQADKAGDGSTTAKTTDEMASKMTG